MPRGETVQVLLHYRRCGGRRWLELLGPSGRREQAVYQPRHSGLLPQCWAQQSRTRHGSQGRRMLLPRNFGALFVVLLAAPPPLVFITSKRRRVNAAMGRAGLQSSRQYWRCRQWRPAAAIRKGLPALFCLSAALLRHSCAILLCFDRCSVLGEDHFELTECD